jgi:3-oxoacyl-[acyl-carrier-protein] synthase-3
VLQVQVAGVGAFAPATGTRNAELEVQLGLEPGWIERRTGVGFRPTAEPSVATSDLAVEAGRRALQSASIAPAEIGLLLLATSTPDHLLPPTAPLVAHRLALTQAGAIDLAGACSGFLYGLILAASHAQATQRAVLVIGANVLSRRVDPGDRNTATIFADGAGAAVVQPCAEAHLLGAYLGADGAHYGAIGIDAGGAREPLTPEAVAAGRHRMALRDGKGLFRQGVLQMTEAGRTALRQAHLTPSDVHWWIPHQANLRMIREAGRLLELPPERTVTVLDRFGNASAAAIPTAWAAAVRDGRLRRGDRLLLTAAGAGLLSAGAVLVW